MKLAINSKSKQYAAIILTVVISGALAWNSTKGWFSYIYAADPPPAGLQQAISLETGNAEFYFLLGQYYDIYDFTAPREYTHELYKKALELNPFNYNYWLSLARFLSKEGKRDDALFTLNEATRLSPGIVSLRWDAGMLASELGDAEALLDNLSSVITNDPDRRKRAFIVLWQTFRNGDEILKIVPEKALIEYLNFLIRTNRAPQAKSVWEKLSNNNETPVLAFLNYVDFLINRDELSYAKQIWANRFEDWTGVWNGGFEREILNYGFDWRIRDVDGAAISREKDKNDENHTIKIEFDGKHNVDFYHFRQYVPVEENSTYKLTSTMKSKDISTNNGLYWQVYCRNGKELYAKSEQVRNSTDWHPVILSFETPEGCNIVSIGLRRNISDRIDRNISGTLWVDDVTLEKER